MSLGLVYGGGSTSTRRSRSQSEHDAAVAALGARLDRPIQDADYGRMANMADPFGNGFDLIEFSGSGYDAVSR